MLKPHKYARMPWRQGSGKEIQYLSRELMNDYPSQGKTNRTLISECANHRFL